MQYWRRCLVQKIGVQISFFGILLATKVRVEVRWLIKYQRSLVHPSAVKQPDNFFDERTDQQPPDPLNKLPTTRVRSTIEPRYLGNNLLIAASVSLSRTSISLGFDFSSASGSSSSIVAWTERHSYPPCPLIDNPASVSGFWADECRGTSVNIRGVCAAGT